MCSSDLVNYKFPEGPVHEHMAKFYGDVTYDESKNRSFQYLYGHIPIDVVQINPFFSKVHDYINKIWSEYKQRDFITSNIYSKKIFRKNLSDMNRNKLFNYLIQLMETENNMKMLSNLIPLDRKSTRLNSSHKPISYAVFCLKKKIKHNTYFLST